MARLESVPAGELDAALEYVRNGGRLAIPTYTRMTIIDKRTMAKFERVGAWLLKAEGDGYRMRSGKTSVYLLPGQLRYVIE